MLDEIKAISAQLGLGFGLSLAIICICEHWGAVWPQAGPIFLILQGTEVQRKGSWGFFMSETECDINKTKIK